MSSGRQWLGNLKSKVKSAQETAKNRLEQLTDTIDKKLKEAQEELEKCGFLFYFYFN